MSKRQNLRLACSNCTMQPNRHALDFSAQRSSDRWPIEQFLILFCLWSVDVESLRCDNMFAPDSSEISTEQFSFLWLASEPHQPIFYIQNET